MSCLAGLLYVHFLDLLRDLQPGHPKQDGPGVLIIIDSEYILKPGHPWDGKVSERTESIGPRFKGIGM